MSQTFNFSSFSKTTLQLLALWKTVDLIFVKNFLFHCFILINVNPHWLISITEPFLFVIFSTILFIFAFVDIVSFTIIWLALLKYAQLSVIKGENLLVMKLIYILNNLCRQLTEQVEVVYKWVIRDFKHTAFHLCPISPLVFFKFPLIEIPQKYQSL